MNSKYKKQEEIRARWYIIIRLIKPVVKEKKNKPSKAARDRKHVPI